jgi:hypothetical protein
VTQVFRLFSRLVLVSGQETRELSNEHPAVERQPQKQQVRFSHDLLQKASESFFGFRTHVQGIHLELSGYITFHHEVAKSEISAELDRLIYRH